VVIHLAMVIAMLLGCKRVADRAAAQPTTLFVTVVDANGERFSVAGGRLTLYRDNVEVVTKDLVGGSQQFDTRVTAKQYCVRPEPPAGYVSKTQVECMTDNAYLTFVWVAVTPTATATPSRTATPTPSATATPTSSPTDKLPPGTPTPIVGTLTPTPTELPTGRLEIVGYVDGVGQVCQCRADRFIVRGGYDQAGLDSVYAGWGERAWLPLTINAAP